MYLHAKSPTNLPLGMLLISSLLVFLTSVAQPEMSCQFVEATPPPFFGLSLVWSYWSFIGKGLIGFRLVLIGICLRIITTLFLRILSTPCSLGALARSRLRESRTAESRFSAYSSKPRLVRLTIRIMLVYLDSVKYADQQYCIFQYRAFINCS